MKSSQITFRHRHGPGGIADLTAIRTDRRQGSAFVGSGLMTSLLEEAFQEARLCDTCSSVNFANEYVWIRILIL